jgi:hypothetical protein
MNTGNSHTTACGCSTMQPAFRGDAAAGKSLYRLPEEIPCAARIAQDESLLPEPYPGDFQRAVPEHACLETFFLLLTGDGVLLRRARSCQNPVRAGRSVSRS